MNELIREAALVSPGDIIQNCEGLEVKVLTVEIGRHGLYISGVFPLGGLFAGYLVEMPPPQSYTAYWKGFKSLNWVTLKGQRYACAALPRPYRDGINSCAAYDAVWDEMREE